MTENAYAVIWRHRGKPSLTGKLELLPTAVRFESRDERLELPYDEITSVSVGRTAADRVDGRPSIVLALGDGDRVAIGTVDRANLVGEIVERLAERTLAEDPPGDEVSYLATPGPGDSEGGDIY